MTEERDDITTEVGSGNVFADLGLPDADELFLKAELVGLVISLLTPGLPA